jgi:hypothetical protein
MQTSELTFTLQVVEPINAWFPRYPLTEGQAKVYYQGLRYLDGSVWEGVMQNLYENYLGKSPPSIAEIRKAHDLIFGEKAMQVEIVKAKQKKQDLVESEKRLFDTDIGQMALAEGWAPSLLADSIGNDSFDIAKASVTHYRESQQKARAAAATLDVTNVWDKALVSLWQSMQEKAQYLFDKHYQRDRAAPVAIEHWQEF